MAREGSHMGLLDQLHATGCDGQEFMTLRPIVVPDEDGVYRDFDRAADIEVIVMEWCAECGAADWELV